jgi:hypothetical protein
MMAVLSGPLLPILLLAIPLLFAVVVILVGIASRLRPSSPIPRAIIASPQDVRTQR